mmetsp:Transcript_51614/g.135609  ORF Transcript_51614/g.135609 Transcript_51614/m.135609 type:complete len:199 (-) Transcript_51614:153-749(-)
MADSDEWVPSPDKDGGFVRKGALKRTTLVQRARATFDEKFLQPAKQLDEHEIAYAVAVGFWNGILPLPGLTVPSQALVVAVFGVFHRRLSMTPVQFSLAFAMHLVTGMSGLEILLMAPYFRLGNTLSEYILAERTSCSVSEMLALWNAHGLLHTLKQLPLCIALSLGAWFLSGLLAVVPVLYVGTRGVLAGRAKNKAA